MQHNYWIYLLIMFAVTYLVRVLPLVVFRKKITNRFVRSFLAYIPYAVLAAMTFPAVFFAVDCIPAAAAGVIADSGDCAGRRPVRVGRHQPPGRLRPGQPCQ